MHYDVLEASKLRFGFSISNLNEVMGVFPLTAMKTVVSNSNCHTYSCQQQGPFGSLQPGENSLYSYSITVSASRNSKMWNSNLSSAAKSAIKIFSVLAD